MNRRDREVVLEGPVGKTLLGMAAPMVLGIASIMLFQAVDALFVGRLGVLPLAAMSYTFPVTMVVVSVAIGMGIGATAVISRAIGGGDEAEVRRLTTDALMLSVALVTVLSLAGLGSIRWLFPLLGASDVEVDLIEQYMVPWYLAVGFLVIPIVGNGAIRATGDTRSPTWIMLVSGGVNLVLDPFLIFGLGPFPRLELQGAAIATGISWVTTFVAALWILHRRERMLDLSVPAPRDVLRSWYRIARIAFPSAGTNVLVPMSAAILTRMVSEHGPDAVAAFGVGTRVESLSMVGVFALSMAATPFFGQNYGAKHFARIREGTGFVAKASLAWGVFVAAALALVAAPLSSLFNTEIAVVERSSLFLTIVPWSYGSLGIAMLYNSLFNALDSPMRATTVVVVRLFVLAVPLAAIGSWVGGLTGLFWGMAVANALIGAYAWWMAQRHIHRCRARHPRVEPAVA
jgi:putative MATE family efflux protein